MATVATIPELLLPGKPAQFVFTAESSGNFVKVWCTSAPRGSKLREALDKQQSARVIVISESDITKRPAYTFDVGGAYELQIEEFQKGAEAYGGRYIGDPDGFRTEGRVTTPTTLTLYVATLLEAEMGVSPDTATLQLYVNDLSIVPTSVAVHGVNSPAITKTATAKARSAADAPAVAAAIAELSDLFAVNVLGNFKTNINSWITKFNAHAADATFHDSPDTNNAIAHSFRNPENLKSITRTLAECAKKFGQHVLNVDPASTTPDPGSAAYHVISGNNVADWAHILLAPNASTIGACLVLFADLHRCLSAHILNTAVHLEADSTHTPIALAELPAAHSAFLAELAALSPTVPANEHTAKVLLVSGASFKEV